MSSLEGRLAALLDDAVPAADGIDFDSVVAGVRRRRTITWSIAGAVLVVLAVAASSTIVATRPDGVGPPAVNVDSPAVVPWIDSPGRGEIAPSTVHTAPPPTNARPCRATDVSASYPPGSGPLGVNGGFYFTFVALRNVGRTVCVLQGYPRITATEPGRPSVVGRRGSVIQNSSDVTENMEPGASTQLVLQTEMFCPARPHGFVSASAYRHFAITLPGGGTVHLTAGRAHALDLRCEGLRESPFFVRQPEPTDAPDPLARLRATLHLPRSVRRATTLRYTVDLANPTSRAISLRPCPSYGESARGAVVTRAPFQLNCTHVSAIPAHGRVRFAMQLMIPAAGRPGHAEIDWTLLSASSRLVRAGVEVR